MNAVFPDDSRTLDEVRQRIGSCQDVAERHGAMVRRGMTSCLLPGHDDRTASMHLFEGKDGKSRYYCHGCHGRGDAIDLALALGEPVDWGSRRTRRRAPTPAPPPPSPKAKELARFLVQRDQLHFELEAAAALARVHRQAAMEEVARNQAFLASHGSLSLIVELADRLRASLIEAYGIPAGFVWPKEIVRTALGLPA